MSISGKEFPLGNAPLFLLKWRSCRGLNMNTTPARNPEQPEAVLQNSGEIQGDFTVYTNTEGKVQQCRSKD